MDRRYLLYSRVVSIVFVLNTVYPVGVKLLQQRLAGDWLHSLLHLLSAIIGIYVAWLASDASLAKLYTWGIGIGYVLLGVYGWFTPGFFLDSPFALPLGPADNIFHLLLGLPALAIILSQRRQAPQRVSG